MSTPTEKTMQFRFVEGFFVGVHRADGPSATEWTELCDELRRRRQEALGLVFFAAGGGPSSKQRQELRESVGEVPPPAVVLTSSMVVRGIITSLNWFFSVPGQVTAFAPEHFEDALTFLERASKTALPAELVLHSLFRLAREIDQPLPETLAGARLGGRSQGASGR